MDISMDISMDIHIHDNPARRATIGDRAFAVAGPQAWNSLPADLRFIRTFSVLNVI